MNYLSTDDIIVAKATGDGKSTLDIIRLSGPSLTNTFKKITKKKTNPKKNYIKKYKLYSCTSGNIIDHVMISYFKGPESLNGQDIIEINCHGGGYIANIIIDDLCKSGLARHALPGEFLFRAYYNNKISILEAEAIDDVIQSDSNIYLHKSLENVDGRLAIEAANIKKGLVELLTIIEHELDFSENEINHTQNDEIIKRIKIIIKRLRNINKSLFFSKITKNGIRVVIAGKPNAGKSSLYNYLLGKNRAIVSESSGTTRDVIESVVEINKHKVILIDTAGHAKTKNKIEKIGIEKSKKEINDADIIMLLAENSDDFNEFKMLMKNTPIIHVLTKNDIYLHEDAFCKISINEKGSIDDLLTTLSTVISTLTNSNKMENHYLINQRQGDIIINCIEQLNTINKNIYNCDSDVIATMISAVLDEFNNIVDPVGSEDVINKIFSGFCIGK